MKCWPPATALWGRTPTRRKTNPALRTAVDPILGNVTPAHPYEPGTWGPGEVLQLIGSDGPWINPAVQEENEKE